MRGSYQVIVVPTYQDGGAAMDCTECNHTGYDPETLRHIEHTAYKFMCVGEMRGEQRNKLNALKALNIAKKTKDLEGAWREVTTDMVLKAISALGTETDKLFAKCPETVRLRSADPQLAAAFNHNGWQVICHDERLPVGRHDRFTHGLRVEPHGAPEQRRQQ